MITNRTCILRAFMNDRCNVYDFYHSVRWVTTCMVQQSYDKIKLDFIVLSLCNELILRETYI